MADDDAEVEDLEDLYRLISDEEAEKLARQAENRLRRAKINVGQHVKRGEPLGDLAYDVVALIAVQVLEGTIVAKTPAQARDLVTVFHQVARLETGKSTSNSEIVTRDEREARIREITEAARDRAATTLELVKDTGTD